MRRWAHDNDNEWHKNNRLSSYERSSVGPSLKPLSLRLDHYEPHPTLNAERAQIRAWRVKCKASGDEGRATYQVRGW